MAINKNTMLSMSLATMVTFIGSIWFVAGVVNEKIGMIDANASGVARLTLKDIQDTIRELKKELRGLQSELRDDPDNRYIQDDVAETQDDIAYYEDLLKCLREKREEC